MKLKHIVIEGLMMMAPYVTNPEENRPYFRSMKNFRKLSVHRFLDLANNYPWEPVAIMP